MALDRLIEDSLFEGINDITHEMDSSGNGKSLKVFDEDRAVFPKSEIHRDG